MKTVSRMMFALGVGVLAVLAAGCAQPPNAEMESAAAAMEGARAAEAAVYAPAEWAAAQAADTAVKAEIAAQEAKVALFRSYSQAKELLLAVEDAARAAERAGVAGREQARAEAETALTEVKSALDAASVLLGELGSCPRKPKGFAQDLELLEGNLQGLVDSVPEAEGMYNDGQFRDATALLTTLGAEIAEFSNELASAKTKIKC